MLVGAVVASVIVRSYLTPTSWRLSVEPRAMRRWLLACSVAAVGSVLLYAALAVHAAQVPDVLGAAALRYGRHDLSWQVLLSPTRLLRLEWMVPVAGIAALLDGASQVAVVRASPSAWRGGPARVDRHGERPVLRLP